MEGADIDPCLAQSGADAPDETRRILVDDVEHVAVEIGLDLNPEQFDQPRGRIAEQRARHRKPASLGLHRDPHQRGVSALANMPEWKSGREGIGWAVREKS